MDEEKLIEKLRLIEALYAGATTEGEQVAAGHARQRILERLRSMEAEDPPVEYRFSMEDMWSRRVFVALLRRYGITPYRYRRQRYTTVMARVSRRFVDETLWPQFERLSDTLRQYLSEVTDRVVAQVISEDLSETVVLNEPQALPPAASETRPPSGPENAPGGRRSPQEGTPSGGAGNGGSGSADEDEARVSKNRQKRKRRRKKRKKKRRRQGPHCRIGHRFSMYSWIFLAVAEVRQ